MAMTMLLLLNVVLLTALPASMTGLTSRVPLGRGVRTWTTVWRDRAWLPVALRRRFLWSSLAHALMGGLALLVTVLEVVLFRATPLDAVSLMLATGALLETVRWLGRSPSAYRAVIDQTRTTRRWWGLT